MLRRFLAILTLALVVGLFATGTAAAGTNPHDLPLTELPVCSGEALEGMDEADMTSGVMPEGMTMDREMMLSDLKSWFSVLPPDIATKILSLAHHMSDETLMMLHYEFHHTNLLHQPPGKILNHVKEMASAHTH